MQWTRIEGKNTSTKISFSNFSKPRVQIGYLLRSARFKGFKTLEHDPRHPASDYTGAVKKQRPSQQNRKKKNVKRFQPTLLQTTQEHSLARFLFETFHLVFAGIAILRKPRAKKSDLSLRTRSSRDRKQTDCQKVQPPVHAHILHKQANHVESGETNARQINVQCPKNNNRNFYDREAHVQHTRRRAAKQTTNTQGVYNEETKHKKHS